jgi:ATP-dependent RNA helicase DHX36
MRPNSLPELQRVPLEEICLSILASGFAHSCTDFLSQAPQSPTAQSIQAALTVLHDIGAVVRDDNTQRESLSSLGKHLAKLPVNVRCGKMLLLGCIFNCIDPILTIAASLASQSPFSTFMNDEGVAKAKQKAFADPNSDFITYCILWDAYTKSPNQRSFCRENYLNNAILREIGNSRKQFLGLLVDIGFLDRDHGRMDKEKLKLSSHNMELVHAVITAGLYPNVARLDQQPGKDCELWHKDERLYFHNTSVNAKKSHSPSSTWVVFDEKFGTSKRTNISTTSFINPLSLILFGGNVVVKHVDRTVIVDEWIEIKMAAQTGVYVREIKKQLDVVLQRMIDRSNTNEVDPMEKDTIDRLCKILSG